MGTKKIGSQGLSPWKTFGTTAFSSKKNALFDIRKALQKGCFRSFAEKGRSPDTKDPHSYVPDL